MEPETSLHQQPTIKYSVHKILTPDQCDAIIASTNTRIESWRFELEKKKREFALTIKKFERVPERLAKAQHTLQQVTERLDQCKDPIARSGYLVMQNALLREVTALDLANELYGVVQQFFLNYQLDYCQTYIENGHILIREVEARKTELVVSKMFEVKKATA